MSNGNALRRAGARGVAPAAAALATLACGGGAAHAQDAKTVLTKMTDLYKNAKSYQGTVTVRQAGKDQQGKPVTTTSVQKVSYQGPNRFAMDMKVSGTGSVASLIGREARSVVSDGKTIFIYQPATKQYMKRPMQGNATLLQLFATMMPNPSSPGVLMGAPTTERGRAAFVVLIKPTIPANVPKEQRAQAEAMIKKIKPMQLVIDKQNYQLLRCSLASDQGTKDTILDGQNFAATPAPKTFQFTPPAGAKEFTPPANPPQGAPPGLPGTPR